ncbi:hypothetical protein BKA65DRAFT_183692 [Rhexocercosporidium sp. MPI-PUGE-AT-0058]|nr:hypothetical protein BKA65DRAFT_183692 [Rhexocercosporidium sp. MPI-PUGE-AT-0058]
MMSSNSRLSGMLLKVQEDGLDSAAPLLETYSTKLQEIRAANPTMSFDVISILAEHETWEVYWPDQPFRNIAAMVKHDSGHPEPQDLKLQRLSERNLMKQASGSSWKRTQGRLMNSALESFEDQLARANRRLKAQFKRRDEAIILRATKDISTVNSARVTRANSSMGEHVAMLEKKQIEVSKLLQLIKMEKSLLKNAKSEGNEDEREPDGTSKEIKAGSTISCLKDGRDHTRKV